MDLVMNMVDHHVRVIDGLLERAGHLPEDVLERPIEISVSGIDDEPTLRSLLARLVGQLAMWEASMNGRPYDFDSERTETIACLKKKFATAGQAFRDDVATVAADDRFDDTFVDATCEPPRTFTYGGMVAHVLSWGSHRRTLVLGALSDAGEEGLVEIAEPLAAF